MGYVGYSLIVASVVWVLVAQPPWIRPYLPPFIIPATSQQPSKGKTKEEDAHALRSHRIAPDINVEIQDEDVFEGHKTSGSAGEDDKDRAAMPPPPVIKSPTIALPEEEDKGAETEQTTPKAEAQFNSRPVPSLSLSGDATKVQPTRPPNTSASTAYSLPKASNAPSAMPPPPLPTSRAATSAVAGVQAATGPARSSPFLANSPQVARGPSRGPLPNRSPNPRGSSSSLSPGLAPPPTHNQPPQKPSKKVLLTPGHSPLDWARISGPTADLRNLPPQTPYLRITPSMLKRQTGRKGKDAWMALGGRVYNISPYVDFHPGGGPELLRGAARDGTKLFAETHPWVNYENMLAACLVGVLVPEGEGEGEGKESEMDQMD